MNAITTSKKGTIHTITYAKELKTRKGVEDTVMKVVTTQGRFGVKYDNIQAVKEARENGTAIAGSMPDCLKWENDYIIKNEKTGKYQLRVTRVHNNPVKTVYLKNGVPVEKSEVEPLCLKSEFTSYSSTPVPVYNIGIEKVLKIK